MSQACPLYIISLYNLARLVSVFRNLVTFVKRNKKQLGNYIITTPAQLADILVLWCQDPG